MGKHNGPHFVVIDLNDGHHHAPPPPPRRHHGGGGECCGCGCFCWCYCCCCCLLIVLVIASAVVTFVYLNPKKPSYAIKDLSVTAFNISSDFTLHTGFNLTVQTENPNERIGITYDHDSSIRLVYRGIDLCTGIPPSFYQGYKNVTVMSILMEGETKLEKETLDELQEDKKKGEIPIEAHVNIQVKLRILDRDTKPVKASVHCELLVSSIEPNKDAGFKSVDCHVAW